MLRIVVNNKDLDIYDNISIPVKAFNPIFSGTSMQELYSFSFDLPASDRNISILQSAERIDGTTLENDIEGVKVYHSGILFFNGVLSVKMGVSKTTYKCNLNSQGLYLAKKLNTVNLQELDLESIDVANPIDTAPNKVDSWKAYLENFLDTEDSQECTHCFPPIKFEPYMSPYRGYADVKNLVWDIFNIYNGANWFADEEYRIGERGVRLNIYGEDFVSTIVPVIKYMHALNSAVKAEGYSSGVVGDFTKIKDIRELAIVSNTSLDTYATSGNRGYNIFNDSYSLQNHLPNMTALDLMTGLRQLFCVIAFDAVDAVEIVPIKDVINQRPIDITRYAVPEYAMKSKEDKGYLLSFELSKNEQRVFPVELSTASPIYYESPNWELTIGDGAVKSSSVHKPTLSIYQFISTDDHPSVANGYYESGKCHYMLILDENYIFNSPFNSREGFDNLDYAILTFYRGKVNGEDGKFYPCATFKNVLSTGEKVGDYTLEWEGKDGLYEQWWKSFLDAINGKKDISRTLIMPIHKIVEMMTFRNPNYTIKGNKGNMKAIIKEMQFTLKKNEISPLQCTFVAK
jgi:hypothetical protein